MPPRKPKQPARKPAAKKGASKSTKNASPDFNPKTHLLGDDGKVYERKTVSGTGAAVGVNRSGDRPTDHVDLEAKMTRAILEAHADGVSDPQEIQKRILQAREDHLDGK